MRRGAAMKADPNPGADRFATSVPEPRLNRFTLRFADRALEAAYQQYHVQGVLQVTRFGLLLAASLYVFYGVLDLWNTPEQLQYLWPLRFSMFAILAGVFALSWKPFFIRHHQRIVTIIAIVTGLNVCAILVALPLPMMNHQNAALLLVIIGSFTLLGVQFVFAVLVGVVLAGTYSLLELFVFGNNTPSMMVNLGYMASAVLLASLGAHAADTQRRTAYYSRLQVEREREESEHRSMHDPLTGLPNRRLLMEKLAHAVARNQRFGTMCAVLFIDVDNFKQVNDRHGHAFGDRYLQVVGTRMRDCLRATDTVARLGGDEFVVLLEDLHGPDDARLLRARLIKCFVEPCHVDGVSMRVDLSMGLALHPHDGSTPEALLEAADRGMYADKRRHGRRH